MNIKEYLLNRMKRKNMRPESAMSDLTEEQIIHCKKNHDCEGVDLNRNFPSGWGRGERACDDNTSVTLLFQECQYSRSCPGLPGRPSTGDLHVMLRHTVLSRSLHLDSVSLDAVASQVLAPTD